MKQYFKVFLNKLFNKDFLLSIMAFMLIQEILYIISKYIINNYHTIMWQIDNKIPFLPYFIYPYNLFYPFVFYVFFIIFYNDRENYYQGIKAGIIGYIIAYIIFFTYPTIMIRPDIINNNIDSITYNLIKLTYSVDNPPSNCFPSIHCLFCFQTIFSLIISKNITIYKKAIFTFILLLIAVSTVFVKQHYFCDILGALTIFIISNILVYILKKLRNK